MVKIVFQLEKCFLCATCLFGALLKDPSAVWIVGLSFSFLEHLSLK